ncbi:MAG: DUF4118 domain-containing protein [Acidimicrobiales bacterium]
MARGTFRVYLGYAPGVGTTHAMLDEGVRRAGRGAAVRVGALGETTVDGPAELARRLGAHGSVVPDVAALVAAAPDVVLVDDLADGSPAHWTCVEPLLEAGIDVVATLELADVAALRDATRRWTGPIDRPPVPDHVVASIDQVDLVDLSAEALRRRVAHGRVAVHDAGTAQRYRLPALGELRLLALGWTADRLAAQLDASGRDARRDDQHDDIDRRPTAAAAPVVVPPVVLTRRPIAPTHRRLAWWSGAIGLAALTAVLSSMRSHVSVGSALLLDLAVVVAVAALGGLVPGLVASVVAVGLTNWFLTPPLHTLTVNDPENVVALVVFVMVTVVISVLVDRSARRSREATTARAEATALARSAATLVGARDPLPELLEQLRTTFGLSSAAIHERTAEGWWPTQLVGERRLEADDGHAIELSRSGDVRLVVDGPAVRADQLDTLRAFADQLALAVEARRLRDEAANAELVAQTDALRAALLRAVSHDFRTPLAAITASASGLQQADATFSEADRAALLDEIVAAAGRLERMVRDLLDISRLQAGAVELALGPVALEEVVATVASGVDREGRVDIEVPDDLPLVTADRALLERALANVVSNALAWSPADRAVVIDGAAFDERVVVRVVDHGPGVAPADRDRIFVPFQRLGDRSRDVGAGLGLAIAHGFVEAMGGTIEADDTPGGGLTMTITLREAAA